MLLNKHRDFRPRLPKDTYDLDVGIAFLRSKMKRVPALCFFNSLFTISENTDLISKLVNALRDKENFHLVVNYTVNSNFHLTATEHEFIETFTKELREKFTFKRHEILDGHGIIIEGAHK